MVGTMPAGFDEPTYGWLQDFASRNLGCDKTRMSYALLDGGRHVFTGCDRSTEYLVIRGPEAEVLGGYGTHTYFLPSPANSAVFAMNCPRERVTLARITPTSYGVDGCGMRGSYVAVMSQTGYEWVANGSSGR